MRKRTGGCVETIYLTVCVLLFHPWPCHGNDSNALRFIKNEVQPLVILNEVYPDEGHVTQVTLTFFPMHIISLNERQQRFILSGWFRVTWRDSSLAWAPEKYCNISKAFVAYDMLWKPDLTIMNSAESLQILTSSSHLLLSADGHVEWLPGNVFSVTCKMDLSSFPFDRQDCFVQVSTWIYTSENVMLSPDATPIRTDNWHENYEWDMYHTYCDVYNQSTDDREYPYVEYHFLLRRRSTFYVLKFLAPIVILSLLNAFVFFVPAESGEKVSLSVSAMLSLTVFLAYLTDITPSNSDTIPEIAIFVFLHLALAALGVICNILLLKLHFHHLRQAAKHRHKMTQKLWTSSVEEQDDPDGVTRHRKNTTQTFWKSGIDENDDVKTQFPEKSSTHRHFFSQNSLTPNHDYDFHPQQTGSPRHVFHDVMKDRYITFEKDDGSGRPTTRFAENSDSFQRTGSHLSKSGWCADHSDFRTNCKNTVLGKCAVIARHLDSICFAFFLLSSLLVSSLFFIRNA
ncbi:hypothetical protein ACOMHN_051326 [Nucella lapillus]